jgi:hypothetical protein
VLESKMKRIALRAVLSSLAVAGAALAVFLLVHGTGAQETGQRVPMISDWSHRHVVFSQPHSFEEAWRLQREPRYWMQVLAHNGSRHGRIDHESEGDEENFSDFERRRREHKRTFERDWGQSLGVGGSTGSPLSPFNPVYPAKFSFNINAAPDCTHDYAVFPTNLAGVTGGQASIIAYNQLYSGTGTATPFCGGANPSVYWSYNTNFNTAGTATTGSVETSPVLSLDGSKIAFVETRSPGNGGAILHLLKWHAGDGSAINTAVAPTTIATAWSACTGTGSCMISIVLSVFGTNGKKADTASSPFYDYQRDVIYVGDDGDVLHKIINAFGVSGAPPSEVVTGNWPLILGGTPSTRLNSPALDSVSGNIFVTDSDGVLSYVREVFSVPSGGTCVNMGSPPCFGGSINLSPGGVVHVISDGPIVDSVTGKVFAFIGNNGTAGPNAAVVQSDVTLSGFVSASLGVGTGNHLHAGAFDHAYLTGNGSAGRLYMCGSSSNSTPTIQRIGFTNSGRSPASPFQNTVGTMNAAVDTVTATVGTNGSAECSPVTELFNANAPTAQDQIFFGVQSLGAGANCGVSVGIGCVMSINVTGIPGSLTIFNSIAEIFGPSGIIVDNVANTTNFPQSSSLYFSSLGNSTTGVPCGSAAIVGVGCAVKVTQAGLN